jgi:hypothetical protein
LKAKALRGKTKVGSDIFKEPSFESKSNKNGSIVEGYVAA